MVTAIEAAVKKYSNLGYNKAALALIEAGDNDTNNPRTLAVDAVIAISPDNKLLLPGYHFAQTGVPIGGSGKIPPLERQVVSVRRVYCLVLLDTKLQ